MLKCLCFKEMASKKSDKTDAITTVPETTFDRVVGSQMGVFLAYALATYHVPLLMIAWAGWAGGANHVDDKNSFNRTNMFAQAIILTFIVVGFLLYSIYEQTQSRQRVTEGDTHPPQSKMNFGVSFCLWVLILANWVVSLISCLNAAKGGWNYVNYGSCETMNKENGNVFHCSAILIMGMLNVAYSIVFGVLLIVFFIWGVINANELISVKTERKSNTPNGTSNIEDEPKQETAAGGKNTDNLNPKQQGVRIRIL